MGAQLKLFPRFRVALLFRDFWGWRFFVLFRVSLFRIRTIVIFLSQRLCPFFQLLLFLLTQHLLLLFILAPLLRLLSDHTLVLVHFIKVERRYHGLLRAKLQLAWTLRFSVRIKQARNFDHRSRLRLTGNVIVSVC